MIAITFGFAEPELCAETNIVRLGLGVHIRKGDFSAENLRQAALYVAKDVDIHRNLQRVSQLVRSEPAAGDVVNRLEDYLENLGVRSFNQRLEP